MTDDRSHVTSYEQLQKDNTLYSRECLSSQKVFNFFSWQGVTNQLLARDHDVIKKLIGQKVDLQKVLLSMYYSSQMRGQSTTSSIRKRQCSLELQ